ncbi:MAG: hypothetical protein WBD20_19135, partial [Pirellulaceae bacterium]
TIPVPIELREENKADGPSDTPLSPEPNESELPDPPQSPLAKQIPPTSRTLKPAFSSASRSALSRREGMID